MEVIDVCTLAYKTAGNWNSLFAMLKSLHEICGFYKFVLNLNKSITQTNQSMQMNVFSAYIPSFSFTKRNYKAISFMYFAI